MLLLESKKRKLCSQTSDCMFIGYVEHSTAYIFLVLKSYILDCTTIIETMNAKFLKHIFSLSNKISHALVEINREITSNEELRRRKRLKKEFSYGNDSQTFLVDNNPLTYSDAISTLDCKFWKETIKSEIDSIMKNKT